MDTTLMENTAEDLIAYKLQRAGILIAKPKNDREGTDLIALMEVKDGASFCRVQCKGRSLINSKSSSITIPKKYANGAFVTCLYIDDGDENNTHLFIFFVDEIVKWGSNVKNEYVLRFTNKNFEKKFISNSFSDKSVDRIKKTIAEANVNKEIRIVMTPIVGNDTIYQDPSKEVRIEQSTYGQRQTTIKDKLTGIETSGADCPGNPKDYEYNPDGVWTAK